MCPWSTQVSARATRIPNGFWCTLQFKNLCSSVSSYIFVQVLTFKTLCMVRCFLWKELFLFIIFLIFHFFRTQVKYLLLLKNFPVRKINLSINSRSSHCIIYAHIFLPLMKDEVLDWEKQYCIFFHWVLHHG